MISLCSTAGVANLWHKRPKGPGQHLCGTQQIREGIDHSVADSAGSKKQSSKSAREHRAGSRKQSNSSVRGKGSQRHLGKE